MRIGRFFMALVSLAATSLHAQVDERTEYVPVLRLVELADGSRVFIDVIGRIVGTIPGGAEMESEGFFTAPPQLLGWPLLVGEVESTPTVGDIDADGVRDVVFASFNDLLYAVRADGADLPGFPIGGFRSGHTPAIADVDGDGTLEVFVRGSGGLHGLRFDGTALPGWPFASLGFPTVGIDDLDGDGDWEIAANDGFGEAFLLDPTGALAPGWPFLFARPDAMSNKGPALGDLDGDGVGEIVFPMSFGPSLYAIDLHGNLLQGFPLEFRFGLRQGVSLGDIDQDGINELVFHEQRDLWVLDHQAQPLPGFPTGPAGGNAAPALGDIDGDGRLEIVFGTPGGDAVVFAYNDDGTPVDGWPIVVPRFTFNSQATLGDIDGDGAVDVVLGGFTASLAARGWIYAWHGDGTPVAGFPFRTPDGKTILGSSVTITDLDQDGDVDLVVGAVTGFGGPGFDGRVYAFDLSAPYDPSTMEWPTLGHDVRHTGRYEPPSRNVALDFQPPLLHLDHPPAVVTLRATLPEELRELAPVFKLMRLEGRSVRLEGTAIGPRAGAGGVRLTQFDGNALADLIRMTLPGASGAVQLEFLADTTPLLTGASSIEVR